MGANSETLKTNNDNQPKSIKTQFIEEFNSARSSFTVKQGNKKFEVQQSKESGDLYIKYAYFTEDKDSSGNKISYQRGVNGIKFTPASGVFSTVNQTVTLGGNMKDEPVRILNQTEVSNFLNRIKTLKTIASMTQLSHTQKIIKEIRELEDTDLA